MTVPQINPADFPDADWPFKSGQLICTKHGYFYNVVKCVHEDYDDEWWVTIENLLLDIRTEVRCPYISRVALTKEQTRSIMRRVK